MSSVSSSNKLNGRRTKLAKTPAYSLSTAANQIQSRAERCIKEKINGRKIRLEIIIIIFPKREVCAEYSSKDKQQIWDYRISLILELYQANTEVGTDAVIKQNQLQVSV